MRLLNLLLGAVGISLPIYVYWAVKTGAWQIYAIFISLILICFIVRFGISLVRRNRVAAAMELMVATACCVIPFIVGLISGVGFVLAATLFLIVLAISGQSLSGSRATRALLAGFIFSIITLIVDLLANWPRLSVPGLQATIPLIALTLALVLSFMFVRQFQHYPLRSKLFIMFVAVALVSIGAVSYVTNRITTEQFNKTVGASFNELANRMAREIGESILANKSAMDGLALNKFVQDSVEEANAIGTWNQSFM